MRQRTAWVLPILMAIVVAACAEPAVVGPYTGPPGTDSVSDASDPLTPSWSVADEGQIVEGVMAEGAEELQLGFTTEDGVVRVGGKSVRLAQQPMDPLAAGLAPVAVPTFDGKRIFYTTWEGLAEDLAEPKELQEGDIGGVPVIRTVDVETGSDQVFRRGSYAATVSADGRVGYVEDLDGAYRYSAPNPSRVMVANQDGSAEQAWSSDVDSRYVTVGWAGDVLLVYEVSEGEYVRTFAFSGAGKSQLVSDGGVVVAISPDGTRVLLVEPGPTGDTTQFVLVDPSTGTRLETASFMTSLGPIQGMYSGDWVGERVVVGPGAGDGNQFPYVFGFAALNLQDDKISLEYFVVLQGIADMVSLTTPRFTAEGSVWFEVSVVSMVDGQQTGSHWEAVCVPQSGACRPVTQPRAGLGPSALVDNWSGGSQP